MTTEAMARLTARDLGRTERLQGLQGKWALIGKLGGPSPDKIAKMSPEEFQEWQDLLDDELDYRPHIEVNEDGGIMMTLPADEVRELGEEWALRPRVLGDFDAAAKMGKGSVYRGTRHLLVLLTDRRKSAEQVDLLPIGAYLGLLEAIGAGF